MRVKSPRLRDGCGAAALGVLAVLLASCGSSTDDAFYATANSKLIRVEARGAHDVTITAVGALGAVGCAAMARSPNGGLYTVCGEGIQKPGPQQLASIDVASGRATMIGPPVTGLQIMGLEFGADGKLYTVGDANPASPTFNSLYTVDVSNGAFSRVGATGAPEFFHDFALDRQGTMYGTTSDALYTIDVATGTATRVVNFVGGGMVMGLSFNAPGTRLYATDWKAPISDVYLVDLRTGFLTPLAATGYAYSHGLASASR